MSGDGGRLAAILHALGADMSTARAVTLFRQPVPQGRPRADARGKRVIIHKDDADLVAELATAKLLRRYRFQPMTGNVAIVAIFYRQTGHTVDADNLMKHLMDAAKGILWVDDSQVTAQCGLVELDRENPRTCFAVAAHESTMPRARALKTAVRV